MTRMIDARDGAQGALDAQGDKAAHAGCGCVSRRGFLIGAGAAAVAVTLLPGDVAWAKGKGKKVAVPLAKLAPLEAVGGAVVVELKGREVLIVRDSESSVHAINPTCTHKKCTVKFRPEDSRFACPCHTSAFALDGTVLGGPAPRPLETYPAQLQLDKARVVVTLPEEEAPAEEGAKP